MDKKQAKLLKTIRKKKIFDFTDFTDEAKETIYFLQSKKLVSLLSLPELHGRKLCKITEQGKAVLYEHTHTIRRANIALFLSIIAIVISFLVAFTPFADWSKGLLSSLLKQ